jgi:pimeloyl-ACP methyl ester carboxylesterase
MDPFRSRLRQRQTTSEGRVHDGRISLACGTIAYTTAGVGPGLLLIHGLGGSRRTWQHLISDLAQTHTVIAPDLPGHGESDAPAGDYSLGAHACALRDLLLALGHRRVSIAGHSLGGGVALQAAYQFPERVDRLVLISSGGLGPEVSYLLRAATLPGAQLVVAALSRIPKVLTRRVLATVPGAMAGADVHLVAEMLHGLRGKRQRKAFICTARSVIDWRGQTVSAARHTGLLRDVPVLVAWGAEDMTIPPRHHVALAERVPHAMMVEVAGAGHYPHETDSARLLPAMTTFLAATEPFQYSEGRWIDQLTQPCSNDRPGPFPPTLPGTWSMNA